jgi:hypothetical protein
MRRQGFTPASELLQRQIREAGEARGFAVARLLTRWAEVVGEDVARLAWPASIAYGRRGQGATLTLLVPGPAAPLVQMEIERIRARVNACYGYEAVARLRLAQTSMQGFAEGRAAFAPPPGAPSPPSSAAAERLAEGVGDTRLRLALAALAANVLARRPPAGESR